VARIELGEVGDQEVIDERVERGDANGSRDPLIAPGNLTLEGEHVILHRACVGDRRGSRSRRHMPTGGAIEQADPQRGLDRRQPAADGRMLDRERPRGTAERSAAGHGEHEPQIVSVQQRCAFSHS
jgi:hypothetical protein